MKINILYIERKFNEYFSLEKVFRQVARSVPDKTFNVSFQQVGYLSNLTGIVKNLLFFRRGSADVYHITGHITYMALVLPTARTVLTIPDLGILLFRTGVRRWLIKKILFDLPIRKSEYVTAISGATRDEIVEYTGCPAEKIRVIEIPLDEDFSVGEKAEFNVRRPRILQIGTAPHKNLDRVIAALEGITCRLVIIGRLSEPTIALLREKNIDYENEFEISDERVKEHYRSADLVVFCSVFEGFGVPIIEAQAMRTPVVTSNINPMREVAGDAALLVDPHDYLEIRLAIKRIIDDKALRETLVAAGVVNAERFHPEVVAGKYAELYREIHGRNQI